jgi:hypothetical protein
LGRDGGTADGDAAFADLPGGLIAGGGVALLGPEMIFDFLTNAM